MKIFEYYSLVDGISRNHAYHTSGDNDCFMVTPCGMLLKANTQIGHVKNGKVTCPDCIKMIKFCKSIDSRNLEMMRF